MDVCFMVMVVVVVVVFPRVGCVARITHQRCVLHRCWKLYQLSASAACRLHLSLPAADAIRQPQLRIKAWFLSLRNALHRTAIQPALADSIKNKHGSDCLRNAGGMPLAAASSWVNSFFRDVFCRTENACGVVRCVTEWWRPRVRQVHAVEWPAAILDKKLEVVRENKGDVYLETRSFRHKIHCSAATARDKPAAKVTIRH